MLSNDGNKKHQSPPGIIQVPSGWLVRWVAGLEELEMTRSSVQQELELGLGLGLAEYAFSVPTLPL